MTTHLADLWAILGELPWRRCAAYTGALIRGERLSDLVIALDYWSFLAVCVLRRRAIRSYLRPEAGIAGVSASALVVAFVASCGTTHAMKIATSYGLGLPMAIGLNWETAAVSTIAVYVLDRALAKSAAPALDDVVEAAGVASRSGLALGLAGMISVFVAWSCWSAVNEGLGSIKARQAAGRYARATERRVAFVQQAESAQRGFLLTGDRAYLDGYRRALDCLRQPFIVRADAALDEPETAKVAEMDEVIRLALAGEQARALEVVREGRGKDLMARLASIARSARETADADIAGHNAEIERSSSRVIWVIPVGGVLAVGSVLASLLMIGRDHSLRLRAEREKLAAESRRVIAEDEAARTRMDAAEKGRFMDAMSHDLRTPFNGLVANLTLGRHYAAPLGDNRLVECLDNGLKIASSAASMLDGFLDYARASRPDEPVNSAPFLLASLVGEVVGIVRGEAMRKEVNLAVDCPPGLLVNADRHKVRRILVNLMANALKFTKAGQVRIAGSVADDGSFEVGVTDTGIGMPMEVVEKIFREGYQANNPERDREKGTGLGLAISKRLAVLMGGEIVVESEVGVGSTFTLRIPAGSAPEGRSAASGRI